MNELSHQRMLGAADVSLFASYLEEEIHTQADLLATLEEMGRLLVAQDLTALAAHLASRADFLDRLEVMDARRVKVLTHLYRLANLEPRRVKIRGLVHCVAPECRQEIDDLMEKLKAQANAVRQQNNRNAMIARHAAGLSRELVHKLFDLGAGTKTYSADGRESRATKKILDRRL